MLRFAAALLIVTTTGTLRFARGDEVDYVRDIKPLLARHCVECHGPAKQQAGLRVDTGALAITGGDSGAAIVAGDAPQSRLLLAVTGESDEASQMPLDRPPLSAAEIDLLRRWIEAGAQHPADEVAAEAVIESDHWAFQPIVRPRVPAPRLLEGAGVLAHNPIDAFLQQRLAEEGIAPAPESDRITLLRRVTLDLTGLLPTPDEVDAFLADDQPGAFDRVVDRLLASPHYGERWGRHWLDAARYADSNGFTIDGGRTMWPYRDWVVQALNADMPFDQFTIEQLAGDLLDAPTTQQLVATGFHRNTLANQEGGTDDEQFRVESVVDRVSTTGTVWMGLTVACAQCHDHKYDPVTQRDFYRLYAIFNNTTDNNDAAGLAPKIDLPTPQQADQLAKLKGEITAATSARGEREQELDAQLSEWAASLEKREPTRWDVVTPASAESADGATLDVLGDQTVLARGNIPEGDTYTVTLPLPQQPVTGLRLETLTHKTLPNKGPGLAGNGNFVLGELEIFGDATRFRPEDSPLPEDVHRKRGVNRPGDRPTATGSGESNAGSPPLSRTDVETETPPNDRESGASPLVPISIARVVADHSQPGHDVSRAIDGDPEQGWAINVTSGNMNVDRQAVFVLAEPLSVSRETDSGESGTGVSRETLTVRMTFRHPRSYQIGRFRISLTSDAPDTLGLPGRLSELAAIPADKRSKQQQAELTKLYRAQDTEWTRLNKIVTSLEGRRKKVQNAVPTSLVMQERDEPREAYVHLRGNFLQQGAAVTPGVPAVLPAIEGEQPNRLDLARWLVDPQHPLTARVTVNRIWQRYFGRGLVETENDFGLQGTLPTHPQLLDWLASELIRQRWSLKSLHRLIVTSHAYRQSSHARPELAQRDPANRLLARQPRLRLEAETIRDVALAASGLLSHKLGGPPVHPPQPAGIYVLTQTKKAWPEARDEDRYRRGMYTQFWRSRPHPLMPTFDAPDANTTCTRRVRSNTPLQALTLANDRSFLELAQGLAARVLRDGPDYDDGRLRALFRFALARPPTEGEVQRLAEYLAGQRHRYSADPAAAATLHSASFGDHTPVEAATWTATARVVMNLDEFITRE